MRFGSRPLLVLLVGASITVAACGDDGPDSAANAERSAELAAEFHAGQTTTTLADGSGEAVAPPSTEPPASTAAPFEPTGVVIPVTVLDNSFRPQSVEISIGDEVLWENRGLNEHNVLSVVGDDWGVEVEDFQPGSVYAHVFTEPGEYSYFCSIHGNETAGMVGTIIVSA